MENMRFVILLLFGYALSDLILAVNPSHNSETLPNKWHTKSLEQKFRNILMQLREAVPDSEDYRTLKLNIINVLGDCKKEFTKENRYKFGMPHI